MTENTVDAAAAHRPVKRPPFWGQGMRLQVQSVLYNNAPEDVARAVASLARAAELAITERGCAEVTLRYGDSSSFPLLEEEALEALRRKHSGLLTIEYDHFGANLGSARGHNRLASASKADFILVQNPDVVVSPRLLQILLGCFRHAGVGMAEAKQVPIEHPKDYDPVTGETSWATTACAMIPMALFRELGGFDADSFFLYCDDVDFSWLIRRAGYRVIFQPAAICFHDKRLSNEGAWQPTLSERYYSAEAALMMAHKWSRPDMLEKYLAYFDQSDDEFLLRAAKAFRERREAGRLPEPIDPDHNVGSFNGSFFARHRFAL